MKQANFEKELPEGYVEAKVVDAKNPKFLLLMNLAALLMAAVCLVLAIVLIRPFEAPTSDNGTHLMIMFAAMIVYIVLHEVVHGIAYKLQTGEKLTFGLSLTVAYCGMPHIYVYRRAAMIAVLAPFLLFSLLFGAAILIFSDPWDRFYAAILFAVHFSGCVGDLYCAILYLVKFRDPTTLMRDTGPKQSFYIKKKD